MIHVQRDILIKKIKQGIIKLTTRADYITEVRPSLDELKVYFRHAKIATQREAIESGQEYLDVLNAVVADVNKGYFCLNAKGQFWPIKDDCYTVSFDWEQTA